MKRVVVIFFLITMSYAVAQTKTAILVNSGLNVPISSEYFSKYWGASYNLGGGVEMSFNPQLSILGYVDYSRFYFDATKVLKEFTRYDSRGVTGSGGNINFLNFNVNIKYRFVEQASQKTFFYMLGGIGYANVSASDLTITDNRNVGTLTWESIGAFSLNVGLGGEFAVSQTISIFADARFIFAFTSGSTVKYSNPDNIASSDLKKNGSYILNYNTGYVPLRVGVSYSLQ